MSSAVGDLLEHSSTEFYSYYSKIYGKRWDSLLSALSSDVQHVALVNPFAIQSDVENVLAGATEHELKELAGCLQLSTPEATPVSTEVAEGEEDEEVDTRFPPPTKDKTGVFTHYLLDAASVITARALAVKPGQKVLDMCAAPGGKSLVIAFDLFGKAQPSPIDVEDESEEESESENESDSEEEEESDEEAVKAEEDRKIAEARNVNPNYKPRPKQEDYQTAASTYKGLLVCNEVSDTRRGRLRKVIEGYVPDFLSARKIQITAQDGTSTKKNVSASSIPTVLYDVVLVDAPCSSERHLVRNPQELLLWSKSRSKINAQRQYGLLSNALRLCAKGGRVCYSTCALSPLENDDVVAKFVSKASEKGAKSSAVCKVIRMEFPIGEKTEFGHMILPDKTGFGPMYICVLQKL